MRMMLGSAHVSRTPVRSPSGKTLIMASAVVTVRSRGLEPPRTLCPVGCTFNEPAGSPVIASHLSVVSVCFEVEMGTMPSSTSVRGMRHASIFRVSTLDVLTMSPGVAHMGSSPLLAAMTCLRDLGHDGVSSMSGATGLARANDVPVHSAGLKSGKYKSVL